MPLDLRLWESVLLAPFFLDAERRVASGRHDVAVTGLVEGARALFLALLAARSGRPLMLVVPDDAGVEAYQRDLRALIPLTGSDPEQVVVLPAMDADPWGQIAPHPEVVRERVVTLGRLRAGRAGLLLVPARALVHWLPSVEEWSAWNRTIRVGDSLPPDRFVLGAMGLGYRRVDIVAAPGEVSRRGGIVDVFPPGAAEPVRIELFGDAVESLRSFDTDHQRSTGVVDEIVIGPASESPPTDEAIQRLVQQLETGRELARGDDAAVRAHRARLDALKEQGYWPGLECLARLTVQSPVTLFDHAPGHVMVVDEPARVALELDRVEQELASAFEQSDTRTLPPPDVLFCSAAEIGRRLARGALTLQELAGDEPDRAGVSHHVASRSSRSYSGRIPELAADLARARAAGRRTVCLMRTEGSATRLREILREYELPAVALDRGAAGASELPETGGLVVGVGGLRSGFEMTGLGLEVLSEREVFGEKRPAADRKAGARAAFVSDFRDLKVGGIVVHVDHGVARYAGLGRPKGGSLNRDFMVLEFSGGDRLFVPADRLDLVQKYTGTAGQAPALDRLGGPGWDRVKSRVRKSVQSMAKELLDLYARRVAVKGHAFGPDTPWQAELEAAFPFELTPDQERAINEVKRDMESERPMDRLLVGDVGFGKTEIAVRAGFKAVLAGHQVALLAPTTVLASQHFATLTERYAPFPVRVELISRFRSAADIRRVLRDVELGTVDVLVGTHRILSRDVEFKKLGLLVVDEEQRFGVAHKERLKQLTVGVDVLSMTATPIPRTLQMSLGGVRDLSVIETPPPGRMAIQTYVLPFKSGILGQAIRQELRRQGQVFVVHNRIETLPAMVRAVAEMAPGARIVAAHGKMPERRLEEVMLRFVRHEADVLVTTTIIENGLDIPRANTMVVNRADRFGLAQLYQLRGRVGRSHHHAYAYFLVPDTRRLSDEARKRLRALQEFSELGAGFRLAAADLEIRGAGELLGTRQHGHIAALGFDLYCQMLERAVLELRGEPVAEREPASLHLGVDIKLPSSYLPEAGDRLVVYKRLAAATDAADVDRLVAETEDRFGHLPDAARNLFDMGRLRLLAGAGGVRSIDVVADRLQIRFHDRAPVDPARLVSLVAASGGSLTPSGMLQLPAPSRAADRIGAVATVLRRILGSDGGAAMES